MKFFRCFGSILVDPFVERSIRSRRHINVTVILCLVVLLQTTRRRIGYHVRVAKAKRDLRISTTFNKRNVVRVFRTHLISFVAYARYVIKKGIWERGLWGRWYFWRFNVIIVWVGYTTQFFCRYVDILKDVRVGRSYCTPQHTHRLRPTRSMTSAQLTYSY